MTGASAKSWPRRHPFMTFFSLLALGLVVWVGYFLLSFELDDYRREIEQSLSSRLSLPVSLGEIDYRFHDVGLSIKLENISIGSSDQAAEIRVPTAWLELEWRGLLLRQVRFAEIEVKQPYVRISYLSDLAEPEENASAGRKRPQPFDSSLLEDLSIRSLTILEGRFELMVPDAAGEFFEITLADLSGSLDDIALGRETQIDLRGVLEYADSVMPWNLLSAINIPADPARLGADPIELSLKIEAFDDTLAERLLPSELGLDMNGRADLKLHASGIPLENLHIHASISGESLGLSPGPAYPGPVPFKLFSLNGNWRPSPEAYRFDNIAIQLDDLRLSGSLTLSRASGPPAGRILLTGATLPVKTLNRWLAPVLAKRPGWGPRLQDQGTFWLGKAEIGFPDWQLAQLDGSLENIGWSLRPQLTARLDSLEFSYADRQWQLSHGRCSIGELPFTFDGTVQVPADDAARLNLEIRGEPGGAKLVRLFHPTPPADLATEGDIPVTIRSNGPLNELKLDLTADLSRFTVAYASLLQLEPSQDGRLSMHATLRKDGLSIDHGALAWGLLQGRADGFYSWDEPDRNRFEGMLTISDLARLHELSPALEKRDISGQLDLNASHRGDFSDFAPEAILTLRDVAVGTGRVIGDISKVNGRIRINDQGLQSERIIAHLGESPISAKLRLADYAEPRLIVDLQASSLRADELIFPSDRKMLRDLHGRLLIDEEKIELADVAVALDKGTKASVDGTIRLRPEREVLLDIHGQYAHVAEIIGLWTDLSPAATEERKARRSKADNSARPRIEIKAYAEEGQLYGMTFRQAEALIVPSREALVIHPLDFHIGEGYSTAQVIIDNTVEGPPLLRISGHAERIDAYEIYHELLAQKSIVRGSLSGDFYLQGQVGTTFLPTSRGRFDIEIHEGVLRKLPILSKVFSILNVSQLFTFKLPDMDTEGMPFTLLEGEIAMERGVLSTEGLVIKSAAMNQAHVGTLDLVGGKIDLAMAFNPLGTVDKVVSRLPVAGWLLTGDEKALLTAHFRVHGDRSNPKIEAQPIETFSNQTVGLLRRTLGLPLKLITDPQIIWGGRGEEEKR